MHAIVKCSLRQLLHSTNAAVPACLPIRVPPHHCWPVVSPHPTPLTHTSSGLMIPSTTHSPPMAPLNVPVLLLHAGWSPRFRLRTMTSSDKPAGCAKEGRHRAAATSASTRGAWRRKRMGARRCAARMCKAAAARRSSGTSCPAPIIRMAPCYSFCASLQVAHSDGAANLSREIAVRASTDVKLDANKATKHARCEPRNQRINVLCRWGHSWCHQRRNKCPRL